MRVVLSSLVLLLGSAIALPSLLRTGRSDGNVGNDGAAMTHEWNSTKNGSLTIQSLNCRCRATH